MTESPCTLGLDFGTNSVRALLVETRTGLELASAVVGYSSGEDGLLLDPSNPDLARQHPQDYLDAMAQAVREAIAAAGAPFDVRQVIGIGVDTTGSTPIPVDADGAPLAFDPRFEGRLDAMVWLWKDHTGHTEAARISETAARLRPQYLAKCGGTYSSEWFWSKIWHCLAVAPDVFEAAYTWVEHADWIPAVLTGTDHPSAMKRGVCAAGHKAFYHATWGWPDEEFLSALDPRLARLRATFPERIHTVADAAGGLTPHWASRLGLCPGTPVAVGAFDAHLGGVGSGIREGTLVKIIGTSTCDMMVTPLGRDLPDIPGLCGIVPESVLPGSFGLEAGQSAVGDIFNWLVRVVGRGHEELSAEAERLRPGETGLLALDWLNGNRTVLVDQRLTGLILGLHLATRPAEIYRALVEATAFGARVIMERFEEYGIPVQRIVNCGGISVKNPLVMQIYADVMNRPLRIARSAQTCALGAAIAGAVVAGPSRGGYAEFGEATDRMTGVMDTVFDPDPAAAATYDRLYALYRRLHDAFGVSGTADDLSDLMKTLLDLRDEVRLG